MPGPANRHGDDVFLKFQSNTLVLDVGCDTGAQMDELRKQGCRVVGLDIARGPLREARGAGLSVFASKAEAIPLTSASVDGVVCRVVLPLTDESQVVPEIARVLRKGGRAYLACHGFGYYLRMAIMGGGFKKRLYALRTIANTWSRHQIGRPLPGFMGDTMYQSRNHLAGYYQRCGLQVREDNANGTFLGQPVFFYQLVEKT